MEESVLKATARTGKPSTLRRSGFIPAVLNEHDTTSTAVQFEAAALVKVIARHGHNAKIWIDLGTEKKYGFVKEIQKDPTEGKIVHVSIQIVSEEQEVKMLLPINFHGLDALEQRMLQLHISRNEVEVSGKTVLMPEYVIVDVGSKVLGDTITAANLHIPPGIRILDSDKEIYAIVKSHRINFVEEPVPEVKPD